MSVPEPTEGPEVLPKPVELLALHDVTATLFDILRRWFDVPAEVSLDLHEIDSAVRELGDPVMIAALAMRKLQALHLLSTPGVRTATDVVVSIVGDLDRALLQAPTMRLHRQAAATDWDAALAALDEGGVEAAPTAPDTDDPEASAFRAMHALLHEAVRAVLEASNGHIRYFE